MRNIVAASLVAICGMLGSAPAKADWVPPFKGNDTGGIIPWSCEAELVAQDVAGNYCKYYGKYARITSVHRQFGDYIAFSCLWTPYTAPYQIPAVPTRAACSAPPQHRIWEREDPGRVGTN